MQRYKNTVHTRSLLQREADCSICNFYPSSPRGEIQWWEFIYPLTADISSPHQVQTREVFFKKDEINLLDLSLWWQLLLSAGSCTVHIKTVFHSKVTQVSLLKTSSIPACKARSLQVTRPLFCRPLCFGRRWGGGESSWAEMCLLGRLGSARISRRWVFHVVLDALLMHRVRKGCRTQMTWAGVPARAAKCY